MQEGFVGNHTVQLSKRPLGIGGIGTPLLPARFLAMPVPGPFTESCQVFQSDQALWVLVYDAFADDMIGVLLQPSLPSTDGDEPPRRGTGAFLLKALPQSRSMVGLGNHDLSRLAVTAR
jgi:hypothetical protein